MSGNKRPYSNAGSPPATQPSKPKKTKKDIIASSSLARSISTPGGGNTPLASSPPYFSVDSPARPRSRSRSRSRSLSVLPGGGGKGKQREDTAVPGGEGGEGEGDAEVDGEDEEIEFSDDEFGSNQKEYEKQKEQLRVLLDHFDPSQMDRYEAFRRSGLNKASVRKLVNQILQQSVGPSILTVVRGFAKVFVGEIVEKARSVATHNGPLTPADLREAYRIYLTEHKDIGRKKLFVK